MSFRVEVAGRAAHAALAAGAPGVVRALFRRSCYLEFPGGRFACVGDAALGRGPLNALVERFEPVELGAQAKVSLDDARVWSPEPLPAGRFPLERLAIQGSVPEEGLGGLLTGASTPLIEYARPSVEALGEWLRGARAAPDAASLIGLGPGLTPSGDDYLGGLLIALRATDRARLADRLWSWLAPRLADRTSAISAAHLAAAAAGEGHEALHACLAALARGDDLAGPLEALGRVGHCSGWDALAGAAAALT